MTQKVHVFGFPHVGKLLLGGGTTGSGGSSSDSGEGAGVSVSGSDGGGDDSRMVIPAVVTKIKHHMFVLAALSTEGLSGGAVVCDGTGGIVGVICGQWDEASTGKPFRVFNAPT